MTFKNTATNVICVGFFLIGAVLLVINFYGSYKGMRVAEKIPASELLFENDITISYEDSMLFLQRNEFETDLEYAVRINEVVQKSIAHLDDWYGRPADLYMQLVPFSENFFLNLMGRFSGLPQMERYHFSNYRRSIERGIGLCGDHAMIMSQLLDKQGIENRLLSFSAGHVVVEAIDDEGTSAILDADYGVAMVGFDHTFTNSEDMIVNAYMSKGYDERISYALSNIYAKGYKPFDSTYTFMRKRYIFERVSYVAKWLLPVSLLIVAGLLLSRRSLRAKPMERLATI